MMDERARTGTPFFFCKAQSSVSGPCDPIVLPADVTQPDWELELGVVIGKPARRVARAVALEHVAGYVVVNDITSRDRVNRKDMKEMGMDWVASKCAPSFLPMWPYLVTAAFVPDPQQLQITLKLNGQTMQDESTADMIFGVARLIETLSTFCLLQPGDLICTGSPAGNEHALWPLPTAWRRRRGQHLWARRAEEYVRCRIRLSYRERPQCLI